MTPAQVLLAEIAAAETAAIYRYTTPEFSQPRVEARFDLDVARAEEHLETQTRRRLRVVA